MSRSDNIIRRSRRIEFSLQPPKSAGGGNIIFSRGLAARISMGSGFSDVELITRTWQREETGVKAVVMSRVTSSKVWRHTGMEDNAW